MSPLAMDYRGKLASWLIWIICTNIHSNALLLRHKQNKWNSIKNQQSLPLGNDCWFVELQIESLFYKLVGSQQWSWKDCKCAAKSAIVTLKMSDHRWSQRAIRLINTMSSLWLKLVYCFLPFQTSEQSRCMIMTGFCSDLFCLRQCYNSPHTAYKLVDLNASKLISYNRTLIYTHPDFIKPCQPLFDGYQTVYRYHMRRVA